jgi:hypothetical protein
MIYIFLRVAAVSLFLIGYFLYQVLVKKKRIVEIQTDISTQKNVRCFS